MKDSANYGRTKIKKDQFVHRVSYWIHHDEYDNIGDIPKKNEEGILDVAHLCNNPICFEPSHLKLCSRIENCSHKLANGTLSRGTKSNFCSITEELAQEIKLSKTARSDKNYMSARQRSEKFGVSLAIVSQIDNGNSWAHLPNKNGDVSPSPATHIRKQRKIAKQRTWSTEDFKKAQKRLESKSVLDDDGAFFEGSQCQFWSGCINRGYGIITVNNQRFRVHVLACCIKNKTLETNGLECRHLCGKKLCINPLHLQFGTHQENERDKVAHGTSPHKLDFKTANKIRSQYKTGKYTHRILAKMYNVSDRTISDIINNKTYIGHPKIKHSGSKSSSKKIKPPTKICSKFSKSINKTESGSKTSRPKKSSKSNNKIFI
jgi:hypothetical protein